MGTRQTHKSYFPDPEGGGPKNGGFTILEVLIYTGIFLILGSALVSVALESTRSVVDGDVFNRVAERNRVVAFRLAQDLRKAIASTVTVSVDGRSLSFSQPAGVDAGGIVPGDTIRYDLVLAKGESVNGADDNGDGYVDEGRLDWRNATTNELVTVASSLDLSASSFSMNNGAVTLAITNTGRLPRNNTLFEVSKNITVEPRN